MEITGVWNWASEALKNIGEFGQWLVTPLPNLNIAPLAIVGSVAGISVIIGFLILNLINFLG